MSGGYYINTDTKRFVAFYSESSSFHTTNGIHPGMAQNTADSLARQTPQGPWNAIGESSPGANLILPSADGKVEDFQLESRHHPIGLNFT